MKNYNDPKQFIKMTLEDIQNPEPGRIVHGPSWWAVTDDGCVLFYKGIGRHNVPMRRN